MKRIDILSILLAAFMLSVCSCDDDHIDDMFRSTSEYRSMYLGDLAVQTSAEATTETALLWATENVSWVVENIPSWVDVSPKKGKGDARLKLSFHANFNNARTASITIRCTDPDWPAKVQLRVSQDKYVPIVHEYVDMGLSVKWATTNIGASSPEQYGSYFKWGETEPRTQYDWKNYKWANGTTTSITKYNTKSEYGYVDDWNFLDSNDDAAYVLWGEEWRMPTQYDFYELRHNCTWEWRMQNSVYGYKVTANNGNSIFLPAAGSYGANYMGEIHFAGYYWMKVLYTEQPDCAWSLGFNSSEADPFCVTGRAVCASIRPVCP